MNKLQSFSMSLCNRIYLKFAVIFILSFPFIAWAQPCDTTFIKRIGQVGIPEKAYKILPIPDGNLLVGGFKGDSSLLLKISPEGEVIWERLFDVAPTADYFYEMIIDSEGKLVVVGRYSQSSNTVSFVMRYDYQNDVVLWTVKTPDAASAHIDGILEKADGSYVAYGTSKPYKMVLAFDRTNGSLLWERPYSTGSPDAFMDAVIIDSAIYTANIQRYSLALSKTRPGISKLNLDGSQVWNRNYLKSLSDVATIHASHIVSTNDTLAVLGYGNLTYVEPYPYKIQFFTTDLDGNLHWAKQYDLPGSYQYSKGLIALPDGYLLLAEITQYYATEILVMKVDKQGQKVWAKTIGGPYDESARSFVVMGGHLYFAGYTESFDSGNDIFIGKMALDGNGVGDGCTIVADAVVNTSNIASPYSGQHLMTPKTYSYATTSYTVTPTTPQPSPNMDMPGCGCNPFLCNILIENPGFENGLTGWNALGEVAITTDAVSGTNAVGICGQDEGSVGQLFTAWPGQVFTASFFGKITDPDYAAEIQLRFLDGGFTPLTTGADRQFLRSHVYEQYFMKATAPSGTAYVQFLAWKERNNCAYFDDVRMCREGDPIFFPDLIVEGLSASNSPVLQGSSLSVEFTISNIGTATTPTGFDVDFYISTSNMLDQSSVLLASYPQLPTAAGVSVNLTANPLLPNSLQPGDYYLFAVVDENGAVIELDEGNNKTAAPFTINAPGPCNGTIILTSQAEVDAFPGCEIIEGDLIFRSPNGPGGTPTDITDLSPMAAVTKVTGNLIFDSNAFLPSLSGLDNLTSIGGLTIVFCDSLQSIQPLSGISGELGGMAIYSNRSLINLDGLEGITKVRTSLYIDENESLENLDGLSNLDSVATGGTSYGFDLHNHPSLTNIQGLQNLTYVGGTFYIVNCVALENLDGLQNLTTIGGSLVLVDNIQLQDISALNALTSIGQNLPVQRNYQLSDCCIFQNLLNSNGIGGTAYISDNAPGCNSDQEIIDTCTQVVDQIDLELSITSSTTAPIYTSYPVEITIKNTGDITATGVKVICKKPSGVVYTGGNEWTATQGNFVYYNSQEWSVGSLAPDASATLTVHYFLLQNDLPVVYAQVIAANEEDSDSMPNNGTPPSVNEDDEASSDDAPPAPMPDLTITNLVSASQVETGADLLYEFDLNNIGDVPAGEFEIGIYVSQDDQISTNDVQVPSLSLTSSPMGTTHYDLYFTTPTTLAAGAYYLILHADYLEQVEEKEEGNNVIVAAFEVVNTPPVDTCIGLIYLNSQADVNAFEGCSVIDGTLHICGADIVDLTPLNSITEVTLEVNIWGNNALTSLEGLNNLTKTNVIDVRNNLILEDISALSNLTSNLSRLEFHNNDQLPSLFGLEGITRVNFLIVLDNANMITLEGLNNLERINHSCAILRNTLLEDIGALTNVTYIGHNLSLRENPSLSNCCGISPFLENGNTPISFLLISDNLQNCNSSQEIISSCDPCQNDFVFTSQAEVDAFSGCSIIDGNLIVRSPNGVNGISSDITDLSPLSEITAITGVLSFENNDSLLNLFGLNNLTSLGGGLAIVGCEKLSNINALSGLSGELENIAVLKNASILTLEGLEGITKVRRNISLENNDALQNLNGLSNVDSVSVVGNFHSFYIDGNPSLVNIQGLQNLKFVGGHLVIIRCDSLGSLDGLENLNTVGGPLVMTENTQLHDVSALENLISVGGYFTVGGNPLLSDCCTFSNLLNSNAIGGPITIGNNAPGCNSEQDIDSACGPTICTGDVILESQAEVDAFSGCSIIDGDLIIRSPFGVTGVSSDIIDLSPLHSLTEVTGSFQLENNDQLLNLTGLENLTKSGTLVILNCDSLNSIQALSGLTGEIGTIVLWDNSALPNLNGLNGLTGSNSYLSLIRNTALQNLDALSNLAYVSFGVDINENLSLTNIQGLSQLTSINGDLLIANNTKLQNLNGLNNITSVKSLIIAANDKLQDVSALNNLTNVDNIFYVAVNPMLSDCCIFDDLLKSNAIGGIITIDDNAPGCNSQQDINDTCQPQGVDLELSMSTSNPNPPIYTTYPVTLTVNNTGGLPATGIKIHFPKPAGVVYSGGNEFTASTGSFSAFGSESWTINSLDAGQSATLTANYFLLQNTPPLAYAQVTAANEPDTDSTPNNGTPPAVNEDDEASTGNTVSPKPDVVIENFNVGNSLVQVGQNLHYTFDIDNIGASTINGTLVIRAYISSDNTLDPSDIICGTNSIIILPGTPFPVVNINGQTPITSSVPVGDYFIILKVDDDNIFMESDETNNLAVKPFTVVGNSGGITFTCPDDVTEQFPPAGNPILGPCNDGTAIDLPFASTDCNSGGLVVTLSSTNVLSGNVTVSYPGGICGPIYMQGEGAVQLDFTATDSCGNQAICSYLYTREQLPHEIAFTNCPDNIVVNVPAGSNDGIASWPDFEFTQTNCPSGSGDPIPLKQAGLPSGSHFPLGTTEVIYKAYSCYDFEAFCNFTVTINEGSNMPDCDAISITSAQGQITIEGVIAPHVLIKVFKPNWTVAFECLDSNCGNPQVVNGLSAGNHYVETKLMDADWSTICKKNQTINVMSLGGGSGISLQKKNNRQRLSFDRIYPNPVKHWVKLEIYSQSKQTVLLDFYDITGRSVHRMEVDLKPGRNEIEQDVSDWRSGTYNVVGYGNGHPAYGRFLKIWEE